MQIPTKTRPAALLRTAIAAMERGEAQAADTLYADHVRRAPGDAEGIAAYAIACLRGGRAATAAHLLRKAVAARPDAATWLTELGYACVALGDFAAARPRFVAALALEPAHPPAHYGVGLCDREDGAWEAAAEAFTHALAGGSEAFPILLKLAEACERAGRTDDALRHFEAAERLVPDHPGLALAFAAFLRARGDAVRAGALVARSAARRPGAPMLLVEAARCARAAGDLRDALAALDRLDASGPLRADSLEERGYCAMPALPDVAAGHWLRAIELHMAAGDNNLAEALADRMLRILPRNAAAWNAKGTLANLRHAIDVAESAYVAARDSDPAAIEARANLALLHESTNRLDEARVEVDAGLALLRRTASPGGGAQRGTIELLLARCRLARRRGEQSSAMQTIDRIDALGPDDDQRVHASFERGKLHDLAGDPDRAIAAFARGNALAHQPWARAHPGRNKALAGIDLMRELVIEKNWLASWKPVPPPRDARKLAFLVGFPRSGTSLLNHVLDSHDAIQALEEQPLVKRVMDGVQAMPRGYPHAVPDFDAQDVAFLREAYFEALAAHGAADDARMVLDKFPMHVILPGLLHRVFPEARFVLAIRHPCDVVLSCFMQNFTLNNTMSNFCTLADTVVLYTRSMELWQGYRDRLPLAVHAIRYEDVVDDFEGQVRALCGFLDVPWQPELAAFSGRAAARGRIATPSYEQVSRPIYRESRYRWERYREHLEPFLPALQPWIERFGYADAMRPDQGLDVARM